MGKGGGEESDGVRSTGSEVEAFGRTKRGSGLVDGVSLAPRAIDGSWMMLRFDLGFEAGFSLLLQFYEFSYHVNYILI